MSSFWDVFKARQDQLWQALLEHIQISFIALLFAVLISIPLGIYLTKKGKIAEPVIGVAAVLQTIVSIAWSFHPLIRDW